ncbi:MerR family transcriptional regulator [Brevibacillus sp. B_LB10_24]|uniref:MerR family transcriptional regulator n=1 Tax=Brevibacillus sp. B_LB10_24 TaxID=3380645 RepID=UPI0038B89F22
MFKIDDVAKETGLTKRSIRYYEEIGLIQPPERTEGGTRLYTQADIERLKKIMDAREVLGFSLAELQRFMSVNEKIEQYGDLYNASEKQQSRADLQLLADNLREELEMINQKIRKMDRFKQEIEALHAKVTEILKEETT